MGLFGIKSKGPAETVPLLVVEDIFSFPHSLTPLYVSNKQGTKAVESALAGNRKILIAYKKKGDFTEEQKPYLELASFCRINQVMKLPNSSSRVLVDCESRVELSDTHDIWTDPKAKFTQLNIDNAINPERGLAMRNLVESFKKYAGLHKKIPQDVLSQVDLADTPHKLVDLIAGAMSLSYEAKLDLFLELDTNQRLTQLMILVESEIQLLDLKSDISGRVKKRMEQSQKEYYINEQIKELNKELGKEDDDANGLKDLESKLRDLPLPPDVRARTQTELKRLSRLSPLTPEAGILRTWLELIVELPWVEQASASIDLKEVRQILDKDHYNLSDGKDRILEYLAAKIFNPDIRSPILCLVGPPGTGKTSLAKSIARSLQKGYVRMSLGGVRDEAEIRGHRRTYVGALPGKIIQGIKKSKVKDPVFLLDEIDKLAHDQRGDPSSALLEVLDPEQNRTFVDHYLELSYDLSKVVFIATANSLSGIPWPLRDRMEIIEVPGYTPFEKHKIAQDYLVPKLLKEHNLQTEEISFEKEAIETIIDSYTNEAGVRSLERNLINILRKVLKLELENGPKADTNEEGAKTPEPVSILITRERVLELLKRPRIKPDLVHENLPPGLSYGLAWTETGGTVLPVEVSLSEGKGDLVLTGSLGDVMKESARIAFSLISKLELSKKFNRQNQDVHIHVPEGATPKDGPSAGITLTTALVSAITGKGIKPKLAMTGEITLTGRVLPVGGIREKTLAAQRLGFTEVIMPEPNKRDTDDLPTEIKDLISIHYVKTIDEVLKIAFDLSLI